MSAPVRPTQFEFTDAQNQVFRDLGKRMTTVGNLILAFGALALLASLAASAKGGGGVVSGVLWCIFGHWTSKAGKGFTAIATTQGSDIDHLMGALDHLRQLYKTMYGLFLSGLVVIVAFIVVAIVVAAGKL
jgi:hypothetical protein